MPKDNDIKKRINLLKESLVEDLSLKTERLIDFYINSFSPKNDNMQIQSQKNRQTKEYIKDGIRIISVLKRADEIKQKSREYSNRLGYSIFMALFIWVASIIFVYFSLIDDVWIDNIDMASAVIILLSQFILMYCSKKNEKDLCECERSG